MLKMREEIKSNLFYAFHIDCLSAPNQNFLKLLSVKELGL